MDAPKCPDCSAKLGCLDCAAIVQEEAWQEFLEQNPNTRNELLKKGPAFFGYDLAGRA